MRFFMILTLAWTAHFAVATPAAADGKCFDKGSLRYIDCRAAATDAPPAVPVAAPPSVGIPPVTIPAASLWTGWYVGVHAGYGETETESQYTTGSPDPNRQFRSSGAVGGAQVGFQNQFANNIVVGAEINGAATGLQNDTFSPDPFAPNTIFQRFETEVDWLASARLRVGYAIGDVLPFVTGGVAAARWEHRIFDSVAENFSTEQTTVGGVAGGGVEMMWADNWILGVEGLYYFFDDEVAIPTFPGLGDKVEFGDLVEARVRVSYRF